MSPASSGVPGRRWFPVLVCFPGGGAFPIAVIPGVGFGLGGRGGRRLGDGVRDGGQGAFHRRQAWPRCCAGCPVPRRARSQRPRQQSASRPGQAVPTPRASPRKTQQRPRQQHPPQQPVEIFQDHTPPLRREWNTRTGSCTRTALQVHVYAGTEPFKHGKKGCIESSTKNFR